MHYLACHRAIGGPVIAPATRTRCARPPFASHHSNNAPAHARIRIRPAASQTRPTLICRPSFPHLQPSTLLCDTADPALPLTVCTARLPTPISGPRFPKTLLPALVPPFVATVEAPTTPALVPPPQARITTAVAQALAPALESSLHLRPTRPGRRGTMSSLQQPLSSTQLRGPPPAGLASPTPCTSSGTAPPRIPLVAESQSCARSSPATGP